MTLQILNKNAEPKNVHEGWRFGSNETDCDIVLDKDNENGISGVHFTINFNWKANAVIIANHSRNEIQITLPHDDTDIIGAGGQRALPDQSCSITLEVVLQTFSIKIPDRGDLQSKYESNLLEQRNLVHAAPLSLSSLRIQRAPKETPIVCARRYIMGRKAGAGTSGTVWAARKADTGDVVALKIFHDTTRAKRIECEIKSLKRLSHVRY